MGINSCGTTMLDQGAFVGLASIDWDTTPKTADFTAVSGNGYFVNTTSTAITVTLPAGSIGDILGFSDYASTFNTNAITISPNGTDKINGINDVVVIRTRGICFTLIYVDSTRGWKSIESNSVNPTGGGFITATGGTITTDGDFKVHTFTGPGTFAISETAVLPSNNNLDYLVIAGGASGGYGTAGGGGAGGYRTSYESAPVSGPTLPASVTSYPITVGAGGASVNPSNTTGADGSNSVFSTITSTGGGGGGNRDSNTTGRDGGSGGGGSGGDPAPAKPGGSGNTPPVSPSQGNDGGTGGFSGGSSAAGGGGGAGSAGSNSPGPTNAGPGGNGRTSTINGSSVTRGGGGGGGGHSPIASTGGPGGGGNGGTVGNPNSSTAGTANTGGGGGGGAGGGGGGSSAGGSGIVIIRYKFQ
jgi:hypothetical protein